MSAITLNVDESKSDVIYIESLTDLRIISIGYDILIMKRIQMKTNFANYLTAKDLTLTPCIS